MKRSACLALTVMLLSFSGSVTASEILFAGLAEGGAPAFQPEFDTQVRERLSIIPGFRLVDSETSRMMGQRLALQHFSSVSREFVEKLLFVVPDSTLLVWGRVVDYSITPKRRSIILGVLEGKVKIAFTVYSLRFRTYSYIGDITCTTVLKKEPVWFYPLRIACVPNATERATVLRQLQDEAAARFSEQVVTIADVEQRQTLLTGKRGGVRRVDEPSISDVFNVPSVKAPTVNQGTIPGSSTTPGTNPPKSTR